MADSTRASTRPAFRLPVTSSRSASCAALAGAFACALVLSGCEKPTVRWLDDAPLATTQPSPLAHPSAHDADSTLADSSALAEFLHTQDLLREAGGTKLVAAHLDSTPAAAESLVASAVMPSMPMPPAPLTELGAGDAPIDSARCPRSLRFADAGARGAVAVWWSKRDRDRVMLLAAWRDRTSDSASAPQGAAWRGPIVVDSLDQGPRDAQAAERGSVGCARPAPSVVVDDRHGYVHVGYALASPDGAGVFYAHQMDPRSAFEPPQAIVYGERLGAVRVAAAGDVVAVAYEDPNSGARPRVSVAISRTSGHSFTDRLVASADNANARDPYVAVRGRAVVVGWSDVPATGDTTFRVRRARVE